MNRILPTRVILLSCILFSCLQSSTVLAETAAGPTASPPADVPRDGQHDFDFNIGTWKTHIRRLSHPLSGSNDWIDLDGSVAVRKVWDGRAQLEEIEADGSTGHFEGLTLFLYNPQAHQWGQYFANSAVGILNQPVIGEFKDGRGEFLDQETFNDRAIFDSNRLVGFTPDSHRFEQLFSDDGGRTSEPNFLATMTRETEVSCCRRILPGKRPGVRGLKGLAL